MLLNGKNVIITGCNRGIGKAILEDCAKNGANILAIIRRENIEFSSYCEGISHDYQIKIDIFYADFQDEDQVKNAAKDIMKLKIPIDVLINNIAISNSSNTFMMTKMEDIKKVFQVNYYSPLIFTQLLCRSMIRRKQGSIIFIASTAIYDAWSNIEYTSSKAALAGAVRRLALELGEYMIRVNAVAPSLTNTDMADKMGETDRAQAVNKNIMKRMAQPEEIADAVVYLASDMSSFVTGQIMRVDGGLL